MSRFGASWCEVSGLGFRVVELRCFRFGVFDVWGLLFEISGSEFRGPGFSRFGVSHTGFRGSGFCGTRFSRFVVSRTGFRGSGFGFWVSTFGV